MHLLDYGVIAVYLVAILAIGFVFGQHQSRKEFFAASGTMGWFAVGLSVMATLFSSNSFVFYPSTAYGNSLRLLASLPAFTAMTAVVIFIFIPVYARSGVETAYEYLERRFHVSVRTLASVLFVLLRIGWMASATFAAAGVVSRVTGLHPVAVIWGVGVVSIGYTMMGGLRAVMWTDVVQFFVFTITILLTLGIVYAGSGGSAGEIYSRYLQDHPQAWWDGTCSMTLKHSSWAILIGVFLESVSGFGADQVAVQRYLSARSERTSQIGALLNLLGMWIVIPGLTLIGIALYVFYTSHAADLAQLNQEANPSDAAMPLFAKTHFPVGMTGLFLAALLAAIMSSIDSGIHSVTTVLVVDLRDRLYPSLRPKTEAGEVRSIRILIVVIGLLAIGLACLVGQAESVFDVGKKLTSGFGGPLLAIFVLAFFSRRTNTFGVLSGVVIATVITVGLMFIQKDWYSVWYWPIGFTLATVLAMLLSYLAPAASTEYTYFDIIRRKTRTSG